jgi:hypothetical protein
MMPEKLTSRSTCTFARIQQEHPRSWILRYLMASTSPSSASVRSVIQLGFNAQSFNTSVSDHLTDVSSGERVSTAREEGCPAGHGCHYSLSSLHKPINTAAISSSVISSSSVRRVRRRPSPHPKLVLEHKYALEVQGLIIGALLTSTGI